MSDACVEAGVLTSSEPSRGSLATERLGGTERGLGHPMMLSVAVSLRLVLSTSVDADGNLGQEQSHCNFCEGVRGAGEGL